VVTLFCKLAYSLKIFSVLSKTVSSDYHYHTRPWNYKNNEKIIKTKRIVMRNPKYKSRVCEGSPVGLPAVCAG